MKELDLLKKDWQKNNAFEQVSELEIYKMLHKKSSSIVKWIFIISIIEFVVLNGISYLLPDGNHTHDDDIYGIDKYLNAIEILSYTITIVFIYLFYKNYCSITATSNTKKLAESILKTRKTVQYYIMYNLLYVFSLTLFITVNILLKDAIVAHKIENHFLLALFMVFVLVLIISGIIWLFYKLLYGFLLKKLKRNYEELKKIDL